MRIIWTKLKGPFLDCLWPRLEGKVPEEPVPCEFLDSSYAGSIGELEDKLRFFYSTTREPGRTVDTRLVSLMTLNSVISVIAVAGLLAAVNLQPTSWYESLFGVAVTVVVFYVLVQCARCLLAAIAGLRRHRYRLVDPSHIILVYSENSIPSTIQQINEEAFVFSWNNWVENRKVDQLELAYIAFRNGLWGALIFFLLVATFACWKLLSYLQL